MNISSITEISYHPQIESGPETTLVVNRVCQLCLNMGLISEANIVEQNKLPKVVLLLYTLAYPPTHTNKLRQAQDREKLKIIHCGLNE